MNKGSKEYKFLWFLENYSYNAATNGVEISSPKFSFDGMGGTSWDLCLYPNGLRPEDKGNVSLFLRKCEQDTGPEGFFVEFQLSLLAVDGSAILTRNFECNFSMYTKSGSYDFVKTEDIHLRRKTEFLPKDTLSVCCRMWKGERDVQNFVQISCRTHFIFEKISFLHAVESFVTLQPDVKKKIEIPSYSKGGGVITSSLHLTSCSCEEIIIEIEHSDAEQTLLKCKLSLIDIFGNIKDCGGFDYRYDIAKKIIYKLRLSLRREAILNRKSEYLQDDKLSLLCECIFSNGLYNETIEATLYELPSTIIKQKLNKVHNKDAYKSPEMFLEYPSVLENLKALHIKQCLTDVDLKTKTKSFPAHKIMLCASSPVFEAILTSDMKKRNIACIEVNDLEDDTVEQLLLFLYSDSIETLHWKSATQLYYAGDKYQIVKLKAMCSSFLIENLNTSNASELLLLAATHNDSIFKKSVEDFILENEEQVFGSKEWENLIETNPPLVIKTMHLKYKRKNEEN